MALKELDPWEAHLVAGPSCCTEPGSPYRVPKGVVIIYEHCKACGTKMAPGIPGVWHCAPCEAKARKAERRRLLRDAFRVDKHACPEGKMVRFGHLYEPNSYADTFCWNVCERFYASSTRRGSYPRIVLPNESAPDYTPKPPRVICKCGEYRFTIDYGSYECVACCDCGRRHVVYDG